MSTGTKPAPKLPPGTTSSFSGISENFSFHASPESFITSRILQLSRNQPEILSRRDVIRVKILNRNVAVVSSYNQIRQVLESSHNETNGGEPAFVAGQAYKALMASFFPAPNLLLADGPVHHEMKTSWKHSMSQCHARFWKEQIKSSIDSFIETHFLDQGSASLTFDLYEKMKTFSWQILLKCFLGLSSNETMFIEIQKLQETLLRGQFSLMPVSINTGFWKSPRNYGIAAREKLQALITQRLDSMGDSGPFGSISRDHLPHLTTHVLMMTSSLAVKGLASLLTALCLNLFVFRDQSGRPLCGMIRKSDTSQQRQALIRSIYTETERLSPPIVGIMRRCAHDSILQTTSEDDADVIIPRGWDAWLYFVGGGRDREVFGETFDSFDPGRYLQDNVCEPLGFGLGSKTCLGRNLIQNIAMSFAEDCISKGLKLDTIWEVRPGVKGWLGWITASPEQWAADMKQLPTQHPTEPVMMTVTIDSE